MKKKAESVSVAMSTRFILPVGIGAIVGSAMTFYYRNNNVSISSIKKWNFNWDEKHESYLNLTNASPPIKPIGYKNITLIRHSQYHRIHGAHDGNDHQEITEIGQHQAILTGKRLKDSGIKFDKIYTSKFKRAQQTCQLIVEQLENNSINDIIYDSNLNEGSPSVIEPFYHFKTMKRHIQDIKKESPAIINAFKTYLCRRDQDMMKQKPNGTEEILIVGHANVFKYFLTRVLQFDENGWARLKIYNCGISRITVYDDGHLKVSHVGDVGHIPFELLTDNFRPLNK